MEIFLERISPDYDNMIIIVVSGEIASDDAARTKSIKLDFVQEQRCIGKNTTTTHNTTTNYDDSVRNVSTKSSLKMTHQKWKVIEKF